MKCILDQVDVTEAAVPEITGRLNRRRVAVVEHSMDGHTAGMLLGARLTEEDGTQVNLAEPRIKAGALLTPPGNFGALAKIGEYTGELLDYFRAGKLQLPIRTYPVAEVQAAQRDLGCRRTQRKAVLLF